MLKKFVFGSEALDYIEAELSYGNTFAHLALDLPLRQGHVTADLPAELDMDTARNFRESIYLRTGLNYGREAEVRTKNFIYSYVTTQNKRYAIFETFHRKGGTILSRKELPHFIFDSEVYWYLGKNYATLESTRRALHSGRDYPLVIGLASVPELKTEITTGQVLDDADLRVLVSEIDHLLIGAWDVEGYVLIWTGGDLHGSLDP